MKIFTNKSIWKKIVIALLIVLLFQTVVMQPVHAGDGVEFAGKLMSPILSLLVGLGDGIMDIIGSSIMGANATLVHVDRNDSWWDTLSTILVAIVAAAAAIALIVLTAGAAAAALAAIGITATVTVGMGTVIAGITAGLVAGVWYSNEVLPDDLYLPMYTYSAEEIFKGNILFFDVNFFTDGKEIYAKAEDGTSIKMSDYENTAKAEEAIKAHGKEAQYYYYLDDNGDEVKTSNQNSAVILRETISSWYNALRNICLVLMLSVLVYIGIRMLLSSVATDKAKYLTMLKDWFVGLCLLFLMHYIMAFSVTLAEKLTDVVKTSVDEDAYMIVVEADQDIKDAVDDIGMSDTIQTDSGDGKEYLYWPTNLMGSLRVQLQMESYGAKYVGLCICFLILCIFTLYFTVIYLKRLLYMAFLTLIAPLVALTYCIDKLNDGQAQGFNKWFKEYIFNLLIQPMHLLLFYILVTSAFELASTNVIYSIVALGFMIPAEKLLRSLFGFEKAHTPPALGPAGATMAGTALSHLLHKGPKKGIGDGKNGGSSGDDSDPGRVPMPREANPIDAFTNNTEQADRQSIDETEQTNQQRMLDAYDDNYNTNEYDMQERDAMAREAYRNNNKGMDPSSQEYADILRESGYSEDEIRKMTAGENSEQGERETNPRIEQEENQTRGQRIRGKIAGAGKNAGRRVKRTLHANWAAQKAAIRSTPRKLKGKIANAHPIRMAGKLAAGAALGTAAGAVGLAIGASTGDLSNVAKIGGGSVAAGASLGSRMAGGIKSPMQDKKIQEVRDDAYNKGEYKQDAMNDYVKDYRKDPAIRNYFEQTFGVAEAKEMLKKGGEVEQYLYNDIKDKKEMKAMHKLQKKGIVKNVDEAIAVSQLGSMIGSDTNNMTTKKRNEWKTRIGEMAKNGGVKDTDTFAEKRLKEIDKLHDFKK